jgi:hypothetical protein
MYLVCMKLFAFDRNYKIFVNMKYLSMAVHFFQTESSWAQAAKAVLTDGCGRCSPEFLARAQAALQCIHHHPVDGQLSALQVRIGPAKGLIVPDFELAASGFDLELSESMVK